ncbi:MAG: hypothetical protein WCI71_19000, partial [Bacteroidota bacterium]
MKFPGHSITTKLLLLFLLVGLSTVLIVGTYSFYSAKRAIMSRTMDQLISVRAVKKQQMEDFFTEKVKNLKNLSRNENTGRIFLWNLRNPEYKKYRDRSVVRGFSSPKTEILPEHEFQYLGNFYSAYGFSNLFLVTNDPRHPLILYAGSGRPVSHQTEFNQDRVTVSDSAAK